MKAKLTLVAGLAAVAASLATPGYLIHAERKSATSPAELQLAQFKRGQPPAPATVVDPTSTNDNGSINPPIPALPTPPETPCPVNQASHLIGMTVRSPRNEKLGRIRDIVFDLHSGRVAYVVMAKAGRRHGTGSDLAIPLNSFWPTPDRRELILNTDPAKVESSLGFSGDNLPPMNNSAFAAKTEPKHEEIFIVPLPSDHGSGDDNSQRDKSDPYSDQGPQMENP